jgi:hypothetical protein
MAVTASTKSRFDIVSSGRGGLLRSAVRCRNPSTGSGPWAGRCPRQNPNVSVDCPGTNDPARV